MNTFNLLLGNSDRRINNLIEVCVRDVCYNYAVVECFRTSRIDELVRLGSRPVFHLIIVAPANLNPEPSRRTASVDMAEVIRAIRMIKFKTGTPILGVAVPQEEEVRVLEAGAENTFPILFDQETFKAEIRRILRVPEQVETVEEEPVRASKVSSFLRSFGLV